MKYICHFFYLSMNNLCTLSFNNSVATSKLQPIKTLFSIYNICVIAYITV